MMTASWTLVSRRLIGLAAKTLLPPLSRWLTNVTVIESLNVPSDLFRPGDTVTITATGTPGGAAFLSVLTGAHDVLVDKKAMTEDPDGTYTGSFPVVADVFPEGYLLRDGESEYEI